MRKDLNNLIDSMEEKEINASEYKEEVKILKEEIKKLNFTISEQKNLIREQGNKIQKSEKIDIPGDIQILNDMIISQRQDLKKKEKDIEILEQIIEELKKELNKSKISGEKDFKNEELINAKKLIVQLTDENETYRLDNEKLKNKIQNLESKTFKKLEFGTTESFSENQVVHADQFNEIIGKNNKLKKNLDTANITINNLIEEVKNYLKDISNQDKEIREKNIKISALTEKFESAKRRNIELQKNVEDFSNSPNLPNEKYEDYELKLQESEKIVRNLKDENERLNNLILELKNNKPSLEYNVIANQCAPKYYQSMLFMRLFSSLEKYKKELIIDSLIQDLLNSQNLDMKRFIIDILSEMKEERKVRETLIEMINSENWLIKLHLVKALSKFEAKEIKEPLKQLLNDPDLDVREAVQKVLKKISE
ncbi:MAG: hypothetical protein EU529_00105 [Promethearchaeota archaeon]|nr:MAG: hypothetical protein EU529_00105 [Candidatus Lokiarchaeota archaeon]